MAINTVSAALILADKSDVLRSRVRKNAQIEQDIHDRVNYAAVASSVGISEDKKMAVLELTIDTEICPVMDYFEIFLSRMIMCRGAAKFLNLKFQLIINGVAFL
jgi:predicted GTPase